MWIAAGPFRLNRRLFHTRTLPVAPAFSRLVRTRHCRGWLRRGLHRTVTFTRVADAADALCAEGKCGRHRKAALAQTRPPPYMYGPGQREPGTMPQYDYDLFTIGAGSGGVRASRMAASFGARVAVAEDRYLGGTCVNVGCVPKKLMVYASHFREEFEDAAGFGWTVGPRSFSWAKLIENKNDEIARLNDVYATSAQCRRRPDRGAGHRRSTRTRFRSTAAPTPPSAC